VFIGGLVRYVFSKTALTVTVIEQNFIREFMIKVKSAQQLIDELALQPHPEGGFFKEVYRSDSNVYSTHVDAQRSTLTCIYFLLLKGQYSRFHRVKHDEVWNFYLGDPLKLIDVNGTKAKEVLLGDYHHKIMSQYVISANHWQAAEPMGEYALVGCSVAPGFDFKDFAFLNTDEKAKMQQNQPELERFF
jgi:predicted cupin superfamily sugar epimerase